MRWILCFLAASLAAADVTVEQVNQALGLELFADTSLCLPRAWTPPATRNLSPTFALLHRSSAPICTFALHIPATCHPGLPPATRNLSPTFAPLHRSSAPICTFALPLSIPPSLRASHLHPCQPANLSTGQLVVRLANWPTGQPVN